MAKYRICPYCGYRNSPNKYQCENENCGEDLISVRVTEEPGEPVRQAPMAEPYRPAPAAEPYRPAPAAEPYRPAPAAEPYRPDPAAGPYRPAPIAQPDARMVRMCDNCGTHNRPNDRKCSQCGEDISDIPPVAENGTDSGVRQEPVMQKGGRRYMLASLSGDLLYEIPEGETVLGREAELSDYLEERLYVGRRQAKLVLKNDRLTIENLRSTNYTFVNNRSLDDRMMELHEGDEIGLGGNSVSGKRQDLAAYFRVVRK